MRKKPVILLIILILLSGCMTGAPAPMAGTTRTRSPGTLARVEPAYHPEADRSPQAFPVLYRKENVRRAMYEPSYGTYLGAWLCAETSLRIFEHQAGRRHAVYVHEMHLDDEVPITWILHCIAAKATPLIIIHPAVGNGGEVHDAEKIICLAQRLGVLNLPMMVAFYPPGHGMSPAEYTIMFRYARAVFLAHAPMAAFVWVAPDANATPQNPFYPGHDAVDWVGLALLAGRNSDGEKTDILSELERFYQSFHAYAPIMLLPLGISHFSRGDYTYRINEAATDIRYLYNALKNFPRIGLIVYADSFTLSPYIFDDFSISAEPALMTAYQAAISHEHFLSALEIGAPAAPRWVRSAFHGYYWEGRIYVSTRTIESELKLSLPRQSAEINRQSFAEARHLSSLHVFACPDLRVIFIDRDIE